MQPYGEADKTAGTSHKELNYTPSVLPGKLATSSTVITNSSFSTLCRPLDLYVSVVDKYKVGLTSYVDGRSGYYNAVFLRVRIQPVLCR